MKPLGRLHTELIRRRISKTKARDEVYLALGRKGPCSSQVLVSELNGTVSHMSVYRTVELFVEIGVAAYVRKGLVELQEPFVQHHHHFRCRKCGREVKFWDEQLEKRLEKLAEGRRMKLESHQIELRGLCVLCAGV